MPSTDGFIRNYVKVLDLETDDIIESKRGPVRYWSKTPVPGGYKLYILDVDDASLQGRWTKTVFKGNQLVTVLRPE